MRRECRERFSCRRLQRKPLVSYPSMHHGTCVSHVPWCMSAPLTRGGGENVPGIPGACAAHKFTYLAHAESVSASWCCAFVVTHSDRVTHMCVTTLSPWFCEACRVSKQNRPNSMKKNVKHFAVHDQTITHIMAWRRPGAKPLSELMLEYC